jgi:hypothetical protein
VEKDEEERVKLFKKQLDMFTKCTNREKREKRFSNTPMCLKGLGTLWTKTILERHGYNLRVMTGAILQVMTL